MMIGRAALALVVLTINAVVLLVRPRRPGGGPARRLRAYLGDKLLLLLCVIVFLLFPDE